MLSNEHKRQLQGFSSFVAEGNAYAALRQLSRIRFTEWSKEELTKQIRERLKDKPRVIAEMKAHLLEDAEDHNLLSETQTEWFENEVLSAVSEVADDYHIVQLEIAEGEGMLNHMVE